MKYLTFEKQGNNYLVKFKDKQIGILEFDISGDYFFYTNEKGGYYWYILQEIADKLKELSDEFDKHYKENGINDSESGILPSENDDIFN